jgi:hypothetical protein
MVYAHVSSVARPAAVPERDASRAEANRTGPEGTGQKNDGPGLYREVSVCEEPDRPPIRDWPEPMPPPED